MSSTDDLFPETLNLEDQFFQEGYTLGVADGQKSGRIEGRIFGLEKGFSKAIGMGVLNGKACVWQARMTERSARCESGAIASLADNGRLRKHILRLATLSDPEGLSLANDEEDVSEFDDRLKDARAKAVIVERIVGEGEGSADAEEGTAMTTGSTQRKVPVRVRRSEKAALAGTSTGEMEDFAGRKGLGGI